MIAIATAVGSALVGGTYFAFSAMIMPALSRRPTADAIATMRSVNRIAERGPFILVFGGTTLAAAALCVTSAGRLPHPGAALELAAGVFALASTAITITANVPLNRRLDRGSSTWQGYARTWTRWNTARAVLALIAVAALTARTA